MMVIVGAQSTLGRAMVRELNKHNFNYLVLATDSTSQVSWADGTSFKLQIDATNLEDWVKENAEELEFIVCCELLANQAELDRLASLWTLGYQHQIPLVGVSQLPKSVEKIMNNIPPPFFWTVLLSENPHSEPEVNNVAQTMYCYIRSRQNSGIRTLGETPI